jgi:hypothetical protein
MNSSKSAVKGMREYEDKILLLHSSPFSSGFQKGCGANYEAGACTVGPAFGLIRFKL